MTWGTVIGPDVSFYQDAPTTPQGIDFDQMKRAGADFVIIRAGQNAWVDPDFATNWKAAKAAGLPRGSYWFYDSRVSPISQAKLFVSLLSGDLPECGAWLDLEENYRGTYQGWQNWKLNLEYLRMNLPRVGIYTAPYYWMQYRPLTGSDAYSFFKTFELWIAHYNVTSPLIPGPWTTAVFWQYGTPPIGHTYGVESLEIDMNYFNGDENIFRNYFNLTEPLPPTEPATGGGMYRGTTNTLAKLWDAVGGTQIDALPAGMTVTGQKPMSNGYTLLESPKRGYTKTLWLSGYVEVIVPPPPPPPAVKVPFTLTLNIDGMKPYTHSGELEKA